MSCRDRLDLRAGSVTSHGSGMPQQPFETQVILSRDRWTHNKRHTTQKQLLISHCRHLSVQEDQEQ